MTAKSLLSKGSPRRSAQSPPPPLIRGAAVGRGDLPYEQLVYLTYQVHYAPKVEGEAISTWAGAGNADDEVASPRKLGSQRQGGASGRLAPRLARKRTIGTATPGHPQVSGELQGVKPHAVNQHPHGGQQDIEGVTKKQN